MINEKWRLSIGAPPVARAIGVVAGLFFAAVGTAFAVIPLAADRALADLTGFGDGTGGCADTDGIPAEYLPAGVSGCGTGFSAWLHGGLGPLKLIGLIGIPFALLGVVMVLRTLRTAAWLDGTTLRMRGAFRSRSVDLATAAVTAGVSTHRNSDGDGHVTLSRVPMLVARDPQSGRTLSLPLQGMGLDHLPPRELRLLADAMTAGRPTAGPHAGPDVDVHRVAAQLREMADNPLQLPAR
jgi:hypothetical protein